MVLAQLEQDRGVDATAHQARDSFAILAQGQYRMLEVFLDPRSALLEVIQGRRLSKCICPRRRRDSEPVSPGRDTHLPANRHGLDAAVKRARRRYVTV